MPSGHGPIDEEHMRADGDGEQDSIGQPGADQGWKGIGIEVADGGEMKSVQGSRHPSSVLLMMGEDINAVGDHDPRQGDQKKQGLCDGRWGEGLHPRGFGQRLAMAGKLGQQVHKDVGKSCSTTKRGPPHLFAIRSSGHIAGKPMGTGDDGHAQNGRDPEHRG